MVAILFSANPQWVRFEDAINHLRHHDELYWEVGYRVRPENFVFPINGYIHVSGRQVEYVSTIVDIISFSPRHYSDPVIAEKKKPHTWVEEWKSNTKGVRDHNWQTVFVMTRLSSFVYNTYDFKKVADGNITNPPNKYVRVEDP